MFDFDRIDEKTDAHEYKNFDELIYQLNLIKNYDKHNNKKSYLHPTLINFQQEEDFKKEDLIYLNNKKHIKNVLKVVMLHGVEYILMLMEQYFLVWLSR